ncbi:MAG: hypothetical protein ACE5FA_02565, partial [Dehalococcoidia bacterium]
MRHLLGFRWADPRRSFAFRLTLVIVALVTVTVAGVTYMAVQIVQDNLRGQIGERFEAQATDVNDLVHVFLEGRVSQVQVMATSDAIVGSVDRRNASYPGGAEEALSEIQSLDERWIAAADDDPLVVSVIDPEENETAHWLADFLTS